MKRLLIIIFVVVFSLNKVECQIDSLLGKKLLIKPYRASIEFKSDSTYEIFAPDLCTRKGQKDYHHGEWRVKNDSILLIPNQQCKTLQELTEVSFLENQFESNDKFELELKFEGLNMLGTGWAITLIGDNQIDTIYYRKERPRISISDYSKIVVDNVIYEAVEIELFESIEAGDRMIVEMWPSRLCATKLFFGSSDLRIPFASFNIEESQTEYTLIEIKD